jgi:hypothetical protein
MIFECHLSFFQVCFAKKWSVLQKLLMGKLKFHMVASSFMSTFHLEKFKYMLEEDI